VQTFQNEEMTVRGASVLIESFPGDGRSYSITSKIIVPDAHKEASRLGKVLALGTGRLQDGRTWTFSVKVGDVVWCPRYPSSWQSVDKMRGIMKEAEILAIVEVKNG
jgi:chaperonin GroES